MYAREEIKCYVMDYHRPYNHMNVIDDKSKIIVIHDGCKSFDECPTAEDDRVYRQILEEDDDSQADDSDASDDYGAEYSDKEEAKQELEELKGSQNNQEEAEKELDDEELENEDPSVGQKRKAAK